MDDDFELAQNSGATKITARDQYSQHESIDRDEADLMRLGKKPVLKVVLGLYSNH